jgi:L-threonylcarbamoyladenylate synthase
MKTEVYKVNPIWIDNSALKKCALLIQEGKLVVFPTETVYGLGANALDDNAVKKIFVAKGRPTDNPLIVHISELKMLDKIVKEIPSSAERLMTKFWPGPLTIIFKKQDIIPDSVTCGLDTVAVRMPSHPVAHNFIKFCGVPIAAPSANLSGKPSPTTSQHVIDDLTGRVECIIDGGDAKYGLESTVIDITGKIPILLRPGAITKEQLEERLGTKVHVANPLAKKPKSPGMKYRHYAPKTRFILVDGKSEEKMRKEIEDLAKHLENDNKKVMIICSTEFKKEIKKEISCTLHCLGSRKDLRVLAANIFKTLRQVDKENYDCIIMGACPEKGIGLAIMNRIRKAASDIVKV